MKGVDYVGSRISNMFSIYSVIGGYPAVIVTLKETGEIAECRKIISNIVRIFCEESARYFNDNIIKESESHEYTYSKKWKDSNSWV